MATALVLAPDGAAAERSFILREGPYRLADLRTELVNEPARTPHVSGSITRMQVALVDRRGKLVPRRIVMLHHVFFRNLSRKRLPTGCAQRGDETFFGTGEENQTLDLPRGYGYPVRRRDRWWIGGMIMSHSSAPRDVYIEYRLRVETAPRRPVRPFWVRAEGCGKFASYGIRGGELPGSVDIRRERWRVPVSGRIVAAGGHLHTGSHDLRITQPACGDRLLFHHRPAYGPPGHPVYRARPLLHEVGLIATSAFTSATGLPVRAGELLDVQALYDAEHPHPGVMAITHIYNISGDGPPGFVADHVERWPVPFDGRIVAAGGHLHGGAIDLRMTQPACGGRTLFHHQPAYGTPQHLVYRVRPVLHEVGPIATSWFSSRAGRPCAAARRSSSTGSTTARTRTPA